MTLPVLAGLDLPHLPPDDRLRAVLQGALSARGVERIPPSGGPHWPAAQFELERLPEYVGAPPETQVAIVGGCGAAVLEEALQIETVGLAFSAKMLLLAGTVEERMLYATFAAEEATHLAGIAPFVPGVPAGGPFTELLGRLVEDGDRATLVLVIQVVLEGWGLEHYRGLARACRTPALASVLDRILVDEARHHGAGVLIAPRLVTGEPAVDVLTSFLDMVRVGPQAVLASVESVVGPMSTAQRVVALRALDTEGHAARRLALIRGLLMKVGADAVVHALEARGRFTPLSPEAAA